MKPTILGLLAVGLLAGPTISSAAVVTWEMRGATTFVGEGVPQPYDAVSLGDPFVALLTFDTSATLLRTREGGIFDPGKRYEYSPETVRASISIASLDPIEFQFSSIGTNVLYVRDNSGDISVEGIIDGYTFRVYGVGSFVQILMRGPVLDIVDGPGLPAIPDPRLADLAMSGFYIGFEESPGSGVILGALRGDFDTIRRVESVPEPGTLALLGLGLAGLGLSRRRKAN